jgi:hypothetical protein
MHAGLAISQMDQSLTRVLNNKAPQIRLLLCGRAGAVTTIRPEIVTFWFRCCDLPLHLKGFQESQKCPIGKVKLH